MDLKNLKKLVEKWVKWSAEKQLELFMKNKKTRKLFSEATNCTSK